ncbi:Vps54-domain-containing protein [Ascobolus immersus RN42]|uniref:Vps54-domain-containing protein n=1 Tax=Ascobolus immersus RN42 TaxID=1160509 RepID=A0A3N4HT11_ASCIM|nr:Vps54-domain-containing protein [Ascobolus immersus RN42]
MPSSRTSSDSSSLLSRSTSQLDLTSPPPSTAALHRLRPRRGSTASSILSLNSSATALDWKGAREAGPASISALIDNTTARTVIPRPTTRDIPPVNLTPIPKLKPSDFAPYLAIAGEFEKYRRAKDAGLEEHLRLTRNEPISPVPSIAELTGLPPLPNVEPVRKRRGNLSATPLSTVPSVYFDENFRLENPRIFDVVSERSDIIRQASPAPSEISSLSNREVVGTRKALASNAILQEKLSWYMDTVEVHLIASISTASNSFFAALGDLRDLHSEAATSVEKIEELRKQLREVDDAQAVKGLEIVRLRRRRDNVDKLRRCVEQMERVVNGVDDAEGLLARGEVDAALQKVETVERCIAGRGEGEVDLRQARALEPLMSNMSDLRSRIGTGFQAQFVETLVGDLRRHVASVPVTETLKRFTKSFQRDQLQRSSNRRSTDGQILSPAAVPPAYAELPDELREKLKSSLISLQKANCITAAIQAYRDEVTKELRAIIKRHLPSDDDASSLASGRSGTTTGGRASRNRAEKTAALARALRNLGPAEAETLLTQTYVNISELARRLGTQQKLLLDITMTLDTTPGGLLSPPLHRSNSGFFNHPATPQPEDAATAVFTGLSDIIAPLLDAATAKLTKVVRIRKENVPRYTPREFYRYLTLNKLFSSECEAVSGRIPQGLQTVIGEQVVEWVRGFAEEQKRGLAAEMEREKWAGRDFDEAAQRSLSRVLEAGEGEVEWWGRCGVLYEEEVVKEGEGEAKEGGVEGLAMMSPDPKDKIRHAVVEGERFVLPGASLALLRGLDAFGEMVVMVPGMAIEIASSLLDYITVFNTLARQLILLAGATKSAGLKHITTKHLAITSRALSFTLLLLPPILALLRRHARTVPPQVVARFDVLRRDLEDHKATLSAKFVSLMSDRLQGHMATIAALDWNGVKEEEVGQPRQYMETLVKATSVLYKVLDKFLPEREVEELILVKRT